MRYINLHLTFDRPGTTFGGHRPLKIWESKNVQN